MHVDSIPARCHLRERAASHQRERGVRAVVVLTAITMVLELVVGHVAGSMALVADGWHMATHVAALVMASVAYTLARRLESHHAFTFGTGKIHTLAGFTSAVLLGLAGMAMAVESMERLASPRSIDVASSLPVAIIGLLVNIASVALLQVEDAHPAHDGNEHEGHAHHGHAHHVHHGHDHNHRAVVMHVMADILTSALAITALLAARFLDLVWLDAVTGLVGTLVIAKWSFEMCKASAFELLDVDSSATSQHQIREALEHVDDVRVLDLHVWSVGRGARSCMATVVTSSPRDPSEYRRRVLEACPLSHLTIEVRRCAGEHAPGEHAR